MKQNERTAFPVGLGAAVIKEYSHDPNDKRPVLSICLPEQFESIESSSVERDRHYAPSAITIYGDVVRELYEGLKAYYEGAK